MDEKKTIIQYRENNLVNKEFIKDNYLSFIIKKTERLATAVYMISNFFDVEEPLKWELRKNVTKLLKNVMSFNNASLSYKEAGLLKVYSDFVELGGLFNLAYNSGFISEMNYQIVFKEINNLAQSVVDYHNGQISSNKTLFDQNYFEVKKDTNQNNIWDKVLSNDYKPQNIKDIKDNVKDNKIIFKGQKKDLDVFFKKYNQENKEQVKYKGQNNLNNNSNERKDKILNLIKEKGEVTIKDISDNFKEISEKTIQRELQKMIDMGQIKKEGERRWTKYSVV